MVVYGIFEGYKHIGGEVQPGMFASLARAREKVIRMVERDDLMRKYNKQNLVEVSPNLWEDTPGVRIIRIDEFVVNDVSSWKILK